MQATVIEAKIDQADRPSLAAISPAEARTKLDTGSATLVDVREPDEHAREHIQGATLAPLSRFDPGALPEGELILHCKSGARSRDAASRALRAGRSVSTLKGGIDAWRAAGLPTVRNDRAPISIMRQVQITAGSIVVAGTLLGALLSPWWLILSGFVGAGLVFAGLTGTCGLAAVLARMPWNKIPNQSCGSDCAR